MVAKGLDFPDVSLVGIINADSMLNLPDFRAAERCFQLIVQAAGRAGRGKLPGQVIIQTYKADDNVIQMALKQDYTGFYYEEIKLRKLLNYPPFSNLLRVVVVSRKEKQAQMMAENIGREIQDITDAKEENLEVLGPAPCPIRKIKNRVRYQLFARCENIILLRSIGQYIISNENMDGVKLEIDINPLMNL
jgi:primosomal protein N' (replication factor Y)